MKRRTHERPQGTQSKPSLFAFESVFSEHAQTTQLALPTQIDPIIPSVMADQVARLEREAAERAAAAKIAAVRSEKRRGRLVALVPGSVAVLAIAAAAFVGSFGQGDAHARSEVAAVAQPAAEAPQQPVAPEIAAALGGDVPAAAPESQPSQASEPAAQAQPESQSPVATNEPIDIAVSAPVVVRPNANANANVNANARPDTHARPTPPSRASRGDGRIAPQAPAQPAAAAPPPKPMVASAPPAPAPSPAKAKSDADFEAAARAAAQASKQLDSTLR